VETTDKIQAKFRKVLTSFSRQYKKPSVGLSYSFLCCHLIHRGNYAIQLQDKYNCGEIHAEKTSFCHITWHKEFNEKWAL
jgi:hypothetical protein